MCESKPLYLFREFECGGGQPWQYELQFGPSLAHRVYNFDTRNSSKHGIAARGVGGAKDAVWTNLLRQPCFQDDALGEADEARERDQRKRSYDAKW